MQDRRSCSVTSCGEGKWLLVAHPCTAIQFTTCSWRSRPVFFYSHDYPQSIFSPSCLILMPILHRASPRQAIPQRTCSKSRLSASCTCLISASDAPKLLSKAVVAARVRRQEMRAGKFTRFRTLSVILESMRAGTDGPSTVSRHPNQPVSRSAKRA